MTVDFELDGQRFAALNGGPTFKFTEAISLVVNCETQEEIDYFWEKLSEGGQKVECGWVKDKYGLSWQLVPTISGWRQPDGSNHAGGHDDEEARYRGVEESRGREVEKQSTDYADSTERSV